MIKPSLHRILIKPENVDESDDVLRRAKAAGIQLQLDSRLQAAVEMGTVVAIGNTAFKEFGTTPEEEQIFVGSRVIFVKYAGKSVKEGDEDLLLINDEDVTGVYVNE